jgi:hypothetical protein
MVKLLVEIMLQKKFKITNYTDKHRYEEVGTHGIRGANGAGKTKNSASKLDRFSLYSANLRLLGSFALLVPALSPFGMQSSSLPHGCPRRSVVPNRENRG